MTMAILGRTQPMSHLPIDEALSRLAACGFDGVEICLEHPDLAPATLDETRVRTVRAQLDDLGLESRSVSYHVDYIHNDGHFEACLEAIELTPNFGTDIFVFGGGGKRGEDGEWRTMAERTARLARTAESAGVLAAKEFEPDFVVGSTNELTRLFAEVGSRALCANLDLGHAFLCDADPFAAIEQLRGRIAHCHVENMATGVHRHLLPHEGDMDLVAYLSALHTAGFAGPLALDLYEQDYEAVAPEAVRFLHECIEKATHTPRST